MRSEKDMRAPNLADLKDFEGAEVTGRPPLRRLLVIGASGQVGGALLEAFGEENMIGTYIQ